MAGFVLIHGAFHTGACFDPVTAILRARGHVVSAPTLPGMGGSDDELRAVTLAGWAGFAIEHCKRVRAESGGPVLLAGHSRGGLVLSAAGETAPDAMDHLAYICAIMLPLGTRQARFPSLAQDAPGVETVMGLVAGGAGISIDPAWALPRFAGECPEELRDHALGCLVTEPTAPLATSLTLTAERWGSVPRTYIECARDEAVPLAEQRQMQDASPGTPRVTLEADHSPFYCAPEALADALDALIPGS